MPAQQGYLGLGSNIGDRRANLQAAVDALPCYGIRLKASSSVYETEPVGEILDQRDFYNACLEIETELTAETLLKTCKLIEQTLGRTPSGPRHGPRKIDIDVLSLGGAEHNSERLTIPPPQITQRAFVLIPLLELNPNLSLPGNGPIDDALTQLGPHQRVTRIGAPLTLNHPSG